MNSYDDSFFLDFSGVDLVISKIQLSNLNDSKSLLSASEVFKNISMSYETNNSDLLSSVERDIINKLNTLKRTHENDLFVLMKTKERYKESTDVVNRLLEGVKSE